MSAPEEEDERRSPFEPPPWWDGPITLLASTGAAFVGVFLAVAVLLMTMLMAMGRLSIQWLPAVVAALGGSAICFAVYRGASLHIAFGTKPGDAPIGRHFPVSLLPPGGWLRRWLEPTVDAHLVIADDELRLRYRRPMNHFILMMLAFQFAGLSRTLGLAYAPLSPAACATGVFVCVALHVWSGMRRHDLRFPWKSVLSVSAGKDRFHVRVEDEEYAEGLLFSVKAKYRERIAALFAERTLFHDEDRGGDVSSGIRKVP